MRVSVIVPALEEAGFITATLSALQPLRAQGHEVIVVDGGSRDATVLIARLLADRTYVTSKGRARQMNFGAQQTSDDVLLFLHADSVLPANGLAAMSEALARGASWGRFDVRISGKAWVLRLVAIMMNLRSQWTGIATGDHGIFVRRALFDDIGGFPDIALMEDIAFCKRLKAAAGPPACVRAQVTTSGRRWETRGPWRTIFTMWRLRLAYAMGADPAALAREYR
jgi:rSAM/selenodomain-associated transferase 2